MRVVVPFCIRDPKTRLASVLSAAERREFAAAMLQDVLGALRRLDADPELLATAPVEASLLGDAADVPVTVDERSLDPAINDVLTDAGPGVPVAIVMADLALATPRALDRLLSADGDVVVAPGRGGGTNALVVRHADFRVNYHGASYLDHLRIAAEVGATVREVDSMRLATDVDAPEDLAELLLHGSGDAAAWLRDVGFELAIDETGVTARREN